MSKTDNICGYEDKKTINWLITTYPRIRENLDKISG